jgi:hypothetical protein
LLEDSFLELDVSAAGCAGADPAAAGVVAASLVAVPAPLAPASAEPCVVFPTAPLPAPPTVAPPLIVSGEPGALCVGESAPFVPTTASPVDGVAAAPVESEVPAVLGAVPGVTVSTTAVVLGAPEPPPLPVPPADIAPGVSVSEPASLGGSRFGEPVRAAIETSGPFFKIPNDFVIKFVRGRGVFCSCCIRAIAVGSGCGTGAPNAISLFFASPASGESG